MSDSYHDAAEDRLLSATKPLCIGFGVRDGRCLNDAGSTHSQLWCQECDDARRAHITAQLAKIGKRFDGV